MRSLRKWAEGFSGYFPDWDELAENPRYWNWKIPTHCGLLEGKYTNHEIQRECAQLLINVCAAMIAVKPEWAASYRVTCVICVPDMFTSEICIYLDEDYFRSHIEVGLSPQGVRSERIKGRSLANEWNLLLPSGVSEIGTQIDFPGYDDGSDAFQGEQWMYGEVSG